MTLYIDESGNTGGLQIKDGKFNFSDQPFYSLAGILIKDEQKKDFELFVNALKIKYKINSDELKAKTIYDSKPDFINELVDYMFDKNISFISELMDKIYFINTQLVNYFFMPYHLFPLDNNTMSARFHMASEVSNLISTDIYTKFIETNKTYTNKALENFYKSLISHLSLKGSKTYADVIKKVRKAYFEHKKDNALDALVAYLPLPDENSKNNLIHLLPNFSAFSNMIGRVQKYKTDNGISELEIIHDEQKQFDIIFEKTMETMKTMDTDSIFENTIVAHKGVFNIENSLTISFVDSKANIFIQAADLLSGFLMRLFNDYSNGKIDKLTRYKVSAKKLIQIPEDPTGINFVIHFDLGRSFMAEIFSK